MSDGSARVGLYRVGLLDARGVLSVVILSAVDQALP